MAREAEQRDTFVTFRVSLRERRDLQLLARAEQLSRSALLRDLVAERLDEVTGEGEWRA